MLLKQAEAFLGESGVTILSRDYGDQERDGMDLYDKQTLTMRSQECAAGKERGLQTNVSCSLKLL